jgi:hypothetical protein
MSGDVFVLAEINAPAQRWLAIAKTGLRFVREVTVQMRFAGVTAVARARNDTRCDDIVVTSHARLSHSVAGLWCIPACSL